MSQPTDWIEAQTAKLLATAKRSGYFREVIQDAKHFESQGYVLGCCVGDGLRVLVLINEKESQK